MKEIAGVVQSSDGSSDLGIGKSRFPEDPKLPLSEAEIRDSGKVEQSNKLVISDANAEGIAKTGALEEKLRQTGRVFTHRYPLRDDFVVSLDLPLDISGSEAQTLSDWLKTLGGRR
jgi:hypothetical protein